MKTNIQFLKYRYIAIGLSLFLFFGSLTVTFMRGGFNVGVDFVGGIKIIAKFEKGVDEAKIRAAIPDWRPMVQRIGEEGKGEFLIATSLKNKGETSAQAINEVKTDLTNKLGTFESLSEESVGPAIGKFLMKEVAWAFFFAILLMMAYLAWRFEMKYAMGAIVAVTHDVLVAAAFCGLVGVEINMQVMAALLTIFGYSVNDTIVIFDRIRENLQNRTNTRQNFMEVIDLSINQTLSRTILTSLTVVMSVVPLYVIGGEGLNEFALTMLFGLFVGTYSTVYIASPVVLAWERFTAKKTSPAAA